jgi:hypothetical protein
MSAAAIVVMPAARTVTLTRPRGRDHTRIAVVIRTTSAVMCRTVATGAPPPRDKFLSTHTHETTNNDVATMMPSSTILLRGALSRSPNNNRHA